MAGCKSLKLTRIFCAYCLAAAKIRLFTALATLVPGHMNHIQHQLASFIARPELIFIFNPFIDCLLAFGIFVTRKDIFKPGTAQHGLTLTFLFIMNATKFRGVNGTTTVVAKTSLHCLDAKTKSIDRSR